MKVKPETTATPTMDPKEEAKKDEEDKKEAAQLISKAKEQLKQ